MKVKDLKMLLNGVPDDFEVVLSKDGEGNGYSPLADHCVGQFDEEEGEFEQYIDDAGTRVLTISESNAIVLWPVG